MVLLVHIINGVNIKIVPKSDTGSWLNAIMRFTAWRGKPIKLLSDNGLNFVGAEREIKEHVAAWNKEKKWKMFSSSRGQMEAQLACGTSFRWSVRLSCQNLQEGNVNGVREPISYERCSLNSNLSCWANIECKNIGTSLFWPERFGRYYPESFLAW